MKPLQSKSAKPAGTIRPLFRPLALPLLKENASHSQTKGVNVIGGAISFVGKGSPQTTLQKSIPDRAAERVRDISVERADKRDVLCDSKSHHKSSSKGNFASVGPILKPAQTLKGFLKNSIQQTAGGTPFKRDPQHGLFASPPAPIKTKVVMLTAPNSTGKTCSNSVKVTPSKMNGSFLRQKIGMTPEISFPNHLVADDSSLRRSEQPQFNQFCLNHPDTPVRFVATRKTTHQSRDGTFRAYCSICADNLSQEGVKVVPIDALRPDADAADSLDAPLNPTGATDQCQKKIAEFMSFLQASHEEMRTLKDKIEKKMAVLDASSAKQIDNLEAFFAKIFESLEAKREFLRHQVVTSAAKTRKSLVERLELVLLSITGLDGIEVDVEKNYYKILNQLDVETLGNILNKYVRIVDEAREIHRHTEDTTHSQSQLTFPEDWERVKAAMDPKVQILIKNWTLGDKKKAKSGATPGLGSLLMSKPPVFSDRFSVRVSAREEGCKGPMVDPHLELDQGDGTVLKVSNLLESAVKSDLVISFDKNNSQLVHASGSKVPGNCCSHHVLPTEVLNESFDGVSVRGYTQLLDKIHQSQSLKQEFYDAYLGDEPRRESVSQPVSSHDSIDFGDNKIFEFENVDDNLAEKQTPELGQKMTYPKYVSEHFLRMAEERILFPTNACDRQFLKDAKKKALFEDD
jgi:hypothetical protein